MVKEVLYIGSTFLAFSVLHSLTASIAFKTRIKELVGERLFEGWFRILYNIFSLITLTPILIFITESTHLVWQVDGWVALAFSSIRLLGIAGILVSLWQIDSQSFAGIRQLHTLLKNQTKVQSEEPLVTKGLYRITRHPLYLFSLLVVWFVPVMSSSWLSFSIGVSLYFFIGSYFEEKKMIRQYGEVYKNYRKSVPWLIPFWKR
jgi:protein-S-isoprenylcysteine O-methyltransferase Ste14